MNKLIVSLDVDNFAEASRLIDTLSPLVNHFKVGIAPFTDFGDAMPDKLQQAENPLNAARKIIVELDGDINEDKN